MKRRRRSILQNTTKTQKTGVQKATEMQISNTKSQLSNAKSQLSVPTSQASTENKKPTGRPTHNPSEVLTPYQVGLIRAVIFTDGWLSFEKTYRNPLVGLQLAERSLSLIEKFVTDLQDVGTAECDFL